MGKEKLKEYILKSGLPLEFEISKILNQLQIPNSNDFFYERENKTFSIDICGFLNYQRDSNLDVDLLIECKYRDPSRMWIFLQDDTEAWHFPFSDKYVDLNHEFSRSFSDSIMRGLFVDDQCVYKGTEIYKKQNNEGEGMVPNSIPRGIYQLKYALATKISEVFKIQTIRKTERDRGRAGYDPYFYLGIPIIVTTAPLYIINSDATVENILNCKDINEILSPVKSVAYYSLPDDSLKNFLFSLIDNFIFNSTNDFSLDTIYTARNNIDPSAQLSTTLIVTSDYFKERIKKLKEKIDEAVDEANS